jgi:drug/metabolite transporter (DMT)-like permease
MHAAFTLACVTVLQTVVMAIYMRWREPGQIGRTLASWRTAVWVGASGVAASAGWFTAMTIQNAAYVRALGQIELLFTLAVAHFFFRERTTRLEMTGIVMTVAGILWLLLSS